MTAERRRAPLVVVGIGNIMRRDDGLGPAVVDELSGWVLPRGVDYLILDGEATGLVDAWQGRRLAICVDTIVNGGPPGAIHRLEVGVDDLPGWSQPSSSHRSGPAEAVALARALDREPEQLVIYGIEPTDMGYGCGLSPATARSVPTVVRRIRDDLLAATRG